MATRSCVRTRVASSDWCASRHVVSVSMGLVFRRTALGGWVGGWGCIFSKLRPQRDTSTHVGKGLRSLLFQNVAQAFGASRLVVELLRHHQLHRLGLGSHGAHHRPAVDNQVAQVVEELPGRVGVRGASLYDCSHLNQPGWPGCGAWGRSSSRGSPR